MTNEELDRLFSPYEQRCRLCIFCVYDLDEGYQCQELRKPLGGNWEINSPNDCDIYKCCR